MASAQSPLIRQYRELMGLSSDATLDEVKKSFRHLAKTYHPDHNSDPEARLIFEKIKKAYEVLIDPVRVQVLNHQYVDEKLKSFCIDGLNICFGSLFGFRRFRFEWGRVNRSLRIGKENPGESEAQIELDQILDVQECSSILDHPSYDLIELIYAGRHGEEDRQSLIQLPNTDAISSLPWVVQNNQGIFYFLNEDYSQALKSYQQLNERLPLNIIFQYRLALCHLLMAFSQRERKRLYNRPNSVHLKAAVQLLKHCIDLSENRPVGRQKALLIKKTLAEALSKSGHKRQARQLWKTIKEQDPRSAEAVYALGGRHALSAWAAKKNFKALKSISERLQLPSVRS